MIRSHTFESSGEAYDVSQCSDEVRDGDVLLVPSEGRVAVLVGAWPIHVGDGDPGAFDSLVTGSFQDFRDGKYLEAAIVGTVLLAVAHMKAAGLPRAPGLIDIAVEHGWAGEFPAQERFNTN